MPAGFRDFRREVQIATAGLEQGAIAAQLAAFAREQLAGAIQRGEASPIYERYVNGRKGASEDTVVPPGPILYEFVWWPEIINYALKVLQERSPVLSGEYRKAFKVVRQGQIIRDFTTIPREGGFHIVNDVPYARKIEVGHMKMRVPPGVVESAERAVNRKYGRLVHVSRSFITLRGDYVLKGQFRRGYKEGARVRLASDTKRGARMTYPALYMDIGED